MWPLGHDLPLHLRYEHNLVRDTAIMAVAHLVWLLLALLLTYALLGLAQNAEVLQLPVEVFFHAHDAVLPSPPFLFSTLSWFFYFSLPSSSSSLSLAWLRMLKFSKLSAQYIPIPARRYLPRHANPILLSTTNQAKLTHQVNKEATGAMLLSNTGTGIWLAAVTLGM